MRSALAIPVSQSNTLRLRKNKLPFTLRRLSVTNRRFLVVIAPLGYLGISVNYVRLNAIPQALSALFFWGAGRVCLP